MTAPTSVLNNLADRWASLGAWASAHTAAPGSTGAAEVTGGTYERLQSTVAAAVAGTAQGTVVRLPIPAGTTVTHTATRTTKTATGEGSVTDVQLLVKRDDQGRLLAADGTLLPAGGTPVPAPEVFNSAGFLDVTVAFTVTTS
ncbi:hypothetical protein [Pseudokineococcus lusitanus]|uniref:Uncharacterized protein n=1 Tax=Pseudokineococcus lusitanus TaxID=763993 RepID=A0A3N1HU62_9ACTN|nr:hypothetical protein [Pseudokineococcus lusitanus]ROP45960.1 hypothetical protein EDC03_0576 [Pseudokineococcus lusitanus]